jgi:hypothetical protein
MKTANKTTTNNKPIRTIRHNGISASVWRNETEKGPFYSVTFQRSYKDGEEWKTTQSFGRNNLLLLSLIASRAFEFILTLPNGQTKSA